jgi:hypothetical protein
VIRRTPREEARKAEEAHIVEKKCKADAQREAEEPKKTKEGHKLIVAREAQEAKCDKDEAYTQPRT